MLVLAAAALDADAARLERISDPTYEPAPGEWVPDDVSAAVTQDRATAAALRRLETTSAAVVFAMSDHGQVATVVDEDAVTMPWGDLVEVFFGGLYDRGATRPARRPPRTRTPARGSWWSSGTGAWRPGPSARVADGGR